MTWFQKFLKWFRTNKITIKNDEKRNATSSLQSSLNMYTNSNLHYVDNQNTILDYIILNELMNNSNNVPQDINNSNIEFDGTYTPDNNSFVPDTNSHIPDNLYVPDNTYIPNSYTPDTSSYDSGSSSYDSGSSSYDSGSSSSDF